VTQADVPPAGGWRQLAEMIEYLASPLLDDLIVQYVRLMPGISPEMINWRYKANVEGPGLIGQAVLNAKVIGMTPFMRERLTCGGGGSMLAFHAIDTVVDEEARGKGVFVQLGRITCDAARDAGAQVVYGFPNAAAARGWFKHNGWTDHGRAPFMVSPLRTGLFMRKLLKRQLINVPLPRVPSRLRAVTTVTRFDERFDELWHAFAAGIGCAVDRTSAYLNWRVARHPASPYTTLAVEEGGRLIAYVIYRTAMKHDGHLGYVMEAMAMPGRQATLADLLRWVRRDLAQRGVDAIMAQCLRHSPNFGAYRRAGFWPIPDRIVPIEVHFGSVALTPAGEVSSRRENWYLSYLDSDSA
jgi:GNAT superfamily N-acetyltransferase